MLKDPGKNPIHFPSSRCALWDQTIKGKSYSLHLTSQRDIEVSITQQVLSLAAKLVAQNKSDVLECMLIGKCYESEKQRFHVSIERIEADINQFHGNQHRSYGELYIPFRIFKGDPTSKLTTDSCLSSLTSVHHGLSHSSGHLDLANLLSLKAYAGCTKLSRSTTQEPFRHGTGPSTSTGLQWFQIDLICPASKLSAGPLTPVPVLNTALAKSLLSRINDMTEFQTEFRFGYLSMDQTRKLVLLLDSDPKALTTPLVGVWVSGINYITDALVWCSCLRYLHCPHLSDRVCLPPHQPFLLALYSQLHAKPEFYNVTLLGSQPGSASDAWTAQRKASLIPHKPHIQIDFDLFSGRGNLQAFSKSGGRGPEVFRMELARVDDGPKRRMVDELTHRLLSSLSQPSLNDSNLRSEIFDEMMPRNPLSSNGYQQSRFSDEHLYHQAEVPDISLIADSQDGSVTKSARSHHPPAKPPSTSMGRTTVNPYQKLTTTCAQSTSQKSDQSRPESRQSSSNESIPRHPLPSKHHSLENNSNSKPYVCQNGHHSISPPVSSQPVTSHIHSQPIMGPGMVSYDSRLMPPPSMPPPAMQQPYHPAMYYQSPYPYYPTYPTNAPNGWMYTNAGPMPGMQNSASQMVQPNGQSNHISHTVPPGKHSSELTKTSSVPKQRKEISHSYSHHPHTSQHSSQTHHNTRSDNPPQASTLHSRPPNGHPESQDTATSQTLSNQSKKPVAAVTKEIASAAKEAGLPFNFASERDLEALEELIQKLIIKNQVKNAGTAANVSSTSSVATNTSSVWPAHHSQPPNKMDTATSCILTDDVIPRHHSSYPSESSNPPMTSVHQQQYHHQKHSMENTTGQTNASRPAHHGSWQHEYHPDELSAAGDDTVSFSMSMQPLSHLPTAACDLLQATLDPTMLPGSPPPVLPPPLAPDQRVDRWRLDGRGTPGSAIDAMEDAPVQHRSSRQTPVDVLHHSPRDQVVPMRPLSYNQTDDYSQLLHNLDAFIGRKVPIGASNSVDKLKGDVTCYSDGDSGSVDSDSEDRSFDKTLEGTDSTFYHPNITLVQQHLTYISMFLDDSDTDCSVEVRALARKYLQNPDVQAPVLSDPRLRRLVDEGGSRLSAQMRKLRASGGLNSYEAGSATGVTQYGMNPTDLTFATRAYMEKYGLIPSMNGNEPKGKRSHHAKRSSKIGLTGSDRNRPTSTPVHTQVESFTGAFDNASTVNEIYSQTASSAPRHKRESSYKARVLTTNSSAIHLATTTAAGPDLISGDNQSRCDSEPIGHSRRGNGDGEDYFRVLDGYQVKPPLPILSNATHQRNNNHNDERSDTDSHSSSSFNSSEFRDGSQRSSKHNQQNGMNDDCVRVLDLERLKNLPKLL